MNPYHQFVSDYARLRAEAKALPRGTFPPCPRPAVAADAPKVLIFSPHPDDEVIIGGLALRLLRELKWNVINVAVTLGSNRDRRAPRLAELRACCGYIGFGLEVTAPNGLEHVNTTTREQEPDAWTGMVRVLAGLLAKHLPRVILFPHELDWNSTHIGTHYLVMDALNSLPADFHCHAVETEFWGAMASPNLMVEIGPADLGDLVTALTFHVGEVQRNPYHLSLPAWMADNVRRGGELVGGQGGAAPDFAFATLYRVRRWANRRLERFPAAGKILTANQDPFELFKA